MKYKQQRIGRAELLFGLAIGIPNFFSAKFLLAALNTLPAVIVYPTYSVATMLAVTLAGALFFREKAIYFNYNLRTKLGMWYGYLCDARHKRTPDQIAQDIAMPRWLVRPMLWLDSIWKFVRGKR